MYVFIIICLDSQLEIKHKQNMMNTYMAYINTVAERGHERSKPVVTQSATFTKAIISKIELFYISKVAFFPTCVFPNFVTMLCMVGIVPPPPNTHSLLILSKTL